MRQDGTWTLFHDMHSGGGLKTQWHYIYVQLPEQEAITWFCRRFGHHPEDIACPCCGENYSITEDDSLEQLTAYQRHCRYDRDTHTYLEEADTGHGYFRYDYETLESFMQHPDCLFVHKDEMHGERDIDQQ